MWVTQEFQGRYYVNLIPILDTSYYCILRLWIYYVWKWPGLQIFNGCVAFLFCMLWFLAKAFLIKQRAIVFMLIITVVFINRVHQGGSR